MKKSDLKSFVKEEIINTLSEDLHSDATVMQNKAFTLLSDKFGDKKANEIWDANEDKIDNITRKLLKSPNSENPQILFKYIVDKFSHSLSEDEISETELEEASFPGRASAGKLKNIDGALQVLYPYMSKGDQKLKDITFRAYYRFYNDGDFNSLPFPFLKKLGMPEEEIRRMKDIKQGNNWDRQGAFRSGGTQSQRDNRIAQFYRSQDISQKKYAPFLEKSLELILKYFIGKYKDKYNELKPEVIAALKNDINEDASADKAAQDAKKVAIDKEIVALNKKKQELSKGTQSTLAENESFKKISFSQLKQNIIDQYSEYIDNFSDDDEIENDMNDEIKNEILSAAGLDELIYILDGLGFNGDDAYDFILDSLVDFGIKETKKIDELARIANTIKPGDADKLTAAKETYKGNWREKLIDAVIEAGESGIAQPDLATAIGKGSQQAINPTVNEFIKLGILASNKSIPGTTKPEKSDKPTKEEKPKAEPKAKAEKPSKDEDGEEDVEIEDTYYKVDDEFDAPEDEPKAKDIEKAEKTLDKATSSHAGTLSPEDEARLDKLKKGINAKVTKLSKMKKADRLKSDEMKVLKQLIGRDDVKKLFKQKGVSLKDLVSDVIAESIKGDESEINKLEKEIAKLEAENKEGYKSDIAKLKTQLFALKKLKNL